MPKCFAGYLLGSERVSDRVPKCFAGYQLSCMVGCRIGCQERQMLCWLPFRVRSDVRSGAGMLCWLANRLHKWAPIGCPIGCRERQMLCWLRIGCDHPVRELKLFKAPDRGPSPRRRIYSTLYWGPVGLKGGVYVCTKKSMAARPRDSCKLVYTSRKIFCSGTVGLHSC